MPLIGLALLWLAMLLLGGRGLDQRLLVAAHVSEGPLASATLLVTSLGGWEMLLALTFFAVAWLLYRRRSRDALLLLVASLTGRAMVGLQKLALGRLRPEDNSALTVADGFAFPSGHAANSMIVLLLLALLLATERARLRLLVPLAVTLSVLIGLSRVMLGVHWPSDVIGGWAFGLLWVVLSLRLAQTLKRNSSTSPS